MDQLVHLILGSSSVYVQEIEEKKKKKIEAKSKQFWKKSIVAVAWTLLINSFDLSTTCTSSITCFSRTVIHLRQTILNKRDSDACRAVIYHR